MNKKIIIFNWKMAPSSLKEAKLLLNSILNSKSYILNSEIVICPPFVYLEPLSKISNLKSYILNLKLAAQDVFWENPPAGGGAYTGEISPKMLKNLGAEYVIIGHSERRRYLGETDEMINKKIKAALSAGLKVVLCVGEPERRPKKESGIRNQELERAKNYVKKQLEKDLRGIHNPLFKIHNSLIVAYEPVWAIGTGMPCRPEDALEMIKFIKQCLKPITYNLKPKVLYGGSVTGKNIKNFIQYKEIDGVLVGGASLKKDEVRNIIRVLNL